jgi:type I restriction enzyme S subunit
MTEGLKPYLAYKPSGVPWLGDVPKHWEVPRLGAVLRERGETNDEGRVTDVLSVMRRRGVIPYAEKGNVGNKKSDDITRYKVVRPNDIVVNCMNVIIGSVGLSRYTGCLSPVYYVLTRRSEDDVPHYLNAYFQTQPFQRSLVRIGNGILAHRMRIPMELLKCEPFPKPPPAEQSAIVRYLDHVDRRIRKYIGAKQKLIGLLNEQKQTIINHAVTRGLDPNVKLKPSGVPWLGDVPRHWQVLPLKRWVTAKITDGPHETPPLLDDGVYFMSAESMVDGHFDFNRRRGFISRNQHEVYCRKCRPRRDDVFMCKSGATTGKVSIVETDREFSVWSPLALIRVDGRRALPRLFYLVLQADYVQRQVQNTWSYGTQPNLSMAAMERLAVALPSIEEQRLLLEHLGHETQAVTAAVDSARREIDLLREYRTRLVADVVTGKLDVRKVAAGLPEETGETESADVIEADADDIEDSVGEAG